MGVGKSMIGRRVARDLRFQFIDSDHAIEEEQGKSISCIFKNEGEASFRAMERVFIESGHPANGCVVSCGGGLVVQSGMKELLKEKGVVICLFASVESIVERASLNRKRPLLHVENPEERIRNLLAERESIYMNSGVCITTTGRSISEVVQHIIRTYKSCVQQI